MKVVKTWIFKYGQEINLYDNGQYEYRFGRMFSMHYHWIEAKSRVSE